MPLRGLAGSGRQWLQREGELGRRCVAHSFCRNHAGGGLWLFGWSRRRDGHQRTVGSCLVQRLHGLGHRRAGGNASSKNWASRYVCTTSLQAGRRRQRCSAGSTKGTPVSLCCGRRLLKLRLCSSSATLASPATREMRKPVYRPHRFPVIHRCTTRKRTGHLIEMCSVRSTKLSSTFVTVNPPLFGLWTCTTR